MAEYQPIASSSPSLVASTMESHDSRESSDDDLIEVESFASFRGYTPREIENLLVTFNEIRSVYRLDGDIEAHFYAVTSSFQMKPDDLVGICPMRKSVPFVSKLISECDVESAPQAVTDEIFDESEIVAKKAVFKINELPADLMNEFYFQFCYLNSKNEVIGVSTPFKFQKDDSKENSISVNYPTAQLSQVSSQVETMGENYDSIVMEKRDDDDFIVVRSQESFLKERIEHLNKSNTLLEYLIRSLEKDLSNKNVELQKMLSKLDIEKANVAKADEDKKLALVDLEETSRKYFQLQKSVTELKQLIEKERSGNEELQRELDNSKVKIRKLEDTFQTIQVDEDELKNILKDKEEEIAMQRDMVANLEQIKNDLFKKLGFADDKMLNLQSSLASALNELHLATEEKNKFVDYDNLIAENQILKQRVIDLESVKEKQNVEIKTLEDELRTSVSNLNNIDSKLQAERNAYETKEQKNALTLDKTKFELIEMHARLEQSRVEYANLYRKYRSLQKMERSKVEKSTPSTSRSNSIISSAPSTSKTMPSEHITEKIDDIDWRLQQLEKDEDSQKVQEEPLKQSSPVIALSLLPKSDLEKKVQKESLLIDIDSEQQAASVQAVPLEVDSGEVRVESNTVAKTLLSTTVANGSNDTVVTIPCIMCDQMIQCRQHEDGSGQMHEMVNHLEKVHMQKMCPVCSTLFDTRLPIFSTYFANHIQNHFNNIKYPNLNTN